MHSFLTSGSIQFLLTSYSVHFISGERLAPQKCCKRKNMTRTQNVKDGNALPRPIERGI